jgi:uncharacterized protein (TIGR02270 family)
MTAAAPHLTHIPDLLEEHVEEIEFLWPQRELALTSARYTLRELSQLEERIEAHVQGVLACGEHATPLLQERLTAEETPAAFAGAYPMLLMGPEPAARVLASLSGARGPRLAGITRALSLAPSGPFLESIRPLLLSAEPPVATAAAEVLAFHRAYGPKPGRLLLLVQEEDPDVRLRAWRVAGYLGIPLEPKLYASALRDENPAVASAALLAAAWSRVGGVLPIVRQLAQAPTAENLDQLRLLGILGTPQDLPLIAAIGRSSELGPARFSLIGAFGHPAVVDFLLSELANPDPTVAVAAAQAFTKITGQSIESGSRAKSPPPSAEEPDEFEAEFQDEIILPNQELARKHWAEVKPKYAQASRICRGFDLSRGSPPDILSELDTESRWETCLRARFEGTWPGAAGDLEAFPQRA